MLSSSFFYLAVPSGYASFFSVQTQQQTGSNFYSAFITQTQSINRASVGGKLELILRVRQIKSCSWPYIYWHALNMKYYIDFLDLYGGKDSFSS